MCDCGAAGEEGGETPEGGETSEEGGEGEMDDSYAFESIFDDASSVSYGGQIARHVLLAELKSDIGAITDFVDTTPDAPVDAAYYKAEYLDYWYKFNESEGINEHNITSHMPVLQTTYDDISSGKNLFGKVAGQDPVVGETACWTEFVGWEGMDSPDALINFFFDLIAERAAARADGAGDEYPVHLTPQGHDLNQLINKTLICSVVFSQVADDYLDEGLTKNNTEMYKGTKNYTALEHAWDEGFGYYGAPRDFSMYTDEELAGKGGAPEMQKAFDSDEDGFIDLKSEWAVGTGGAVAGAKRDLGSQTGTTLNDDAYAALLAGRQWIVDTAPGNEDGTLDGDQLAELRGVAQVVVDNYEASMAATVVHYINDTLGDYNADELNFSDLAKHWGEMKGYSLCFQFSPAGPLGPNNTADFATLQGLLGTAPALGDDVEAYKADLLAARDLLETAYGFDADDVANW